MSSILIVNAKIVNEGKVFEGDVRTKDGLIEVVGAQLSPRPGDRIIDAGGNLLLPGAIDDQVHFREPGLLHKGTIYTESRAAVAGGVTSFMEMPNTVPPVFTQDLLEEKYAIAARTSLANYSFYIGASNDNIEEVLKTDLLKVCGLKIFMGSSTGNLLVDNEKILEGFFSRFPGLIATHCEDEPTIRKNTELFRQKYGEEMPVQYHPLLRSEAACYASSSLAVGLARKHGTRLHILHISTAREVNLFEVIPLEQKKITAEACIHHLWFNDSDYDRLGMFIKWNPAIKTAKDQEAIWSGLLDGHIDVIATDHAPHTLQEKSNSYFTAPSGGPLVQHSVTAMLEFHKQGRITLPAIVQKMSHNPATAFQIERRGFIREGYFADLVLINPNKPWTVTRDNSLAKCRWSPFEGVTFHSSVTHTIVSGHLAYADGNLDNSVQGQRMTFTRK